MKHVTIETPNCDGFLEPSELREVESEIKTLITGLKDLELYCQSKARAMELRLAGDIAGAIRCEKSAEKFYGWLPDNLKW